MSDRILVVAGARALDVSPAARLWAMRELAARVLSGRYTTVVQGRCAKSPDEWADESRPARPPVPELHDQDGAALPRGGQVRTCCAHVGGSGAST